MAIKRQQLEEIHNNFTNGNLKDMVLSIDRYGLEDVFSDYKEYLTDMFPDTPKDVLYYFSHTVTIYHRIKASKANDL